MADVKGDFALCGERPAYSPPARDQPDAGRKNARRKVLSKKFKGGDAIKAKEKLFCYWFQKLRNGREAAVKSGYVPLFADNTAAKLLQRADVLEHIEALDDAAQTKKLKQAAIAGLSRLAFGSVTDSVKLVFAESEEALTLLDGLDLYAVSELKRPKENALELKFFDRYRALEKLLELASADQTNENLQALYGALEQSAAGEEGKDSDDLHQ